MSNNSYYKNLPKKRMAVGVLFFNNKNELLIVKPTYKDHWSIPGGVVDKNESLRGACIREVEEETGLRLKKVRLLCVDYMSPQASEYQNKTENLQIIFDGGRLKQSQIQSIKIPPKEIQEYKFVKIKEAVKLISGNLSRRLPVCFKAKKENTAFYLEHGKRL